MDANVWSIYGAEWSVATGGKWDDRENGSNKPKPLPWVATGCRSGRMVRRGSRVRVRQRALKRAERLERRLELPYVGEPERAASPGGLAGSAAVESVDDGHSSANSHDDPKDGSWSRPMGGSGRPPRPRVALAGQRVGMSRVEVRDLGEPEAIVTYPLGASSQVRLGGTVVTRHVLQPGWSWEEHAQP